MKIENFFSLLSNTRRYCNGISSAGIRSRLQHIVYRFPSALTDLLWPRICVSCRNLCEDGFSILCASCFSECQLVLPYDRCRRCFSRLPPCDEKGLSPQRCPFCLPKTLPIDRSGYCFDDNPVLRRLLRFLRSDTHHGGNTQSQESVASFFFLQYALLQFPPTDAVFLLPSFPQETELSPPLLSQETLRHFSKLYSLYESKRSAPCFMIDAATKKCISMRQEIEDDIRKNSPPYRARAILLTERYGTLAQITAITQHVAAQGFYHIDMLCLFGNDD